MTQHHSTKYVLSVDLGSGGPKVALVSDRGDIIERARGFTPLKLTPDGGAEQKPDDWWQSISSAAREILGRGTVPIDDVIAVCCASQWSVTLPVDAQGQPLMNAIHWMDARGAPYTHQITDGLIKVAGYEFRKLATWLRLTGGAPTHSGADSLAHILYVQHERPDVYRRTFKFLEPMDYLTMRLTGRFVSSPASAYPLLLTDNRPGRPLGYVDQLLSWTGIDRDKLPDLTPAGTVLGKIRPEAADEWGLSRNTQVVVGTGDSQAAVLGSGAVHDYRGHVCIGTSSWLTCHVPFKKTDIFHYLATMPAAIPSRNMVMAEQGAAGKCLELFIQNWLTGPSGASGAGDGTDPFDELLRLAETAPAGSYGMLFLPWLNGAGPPSGDGSMRGGFLNLSLTTGRPEAVRSVMEGVAFNLRWLSGHVEKFIRRPLDSLNFIGGGARSPLWCQIMADVLERPIHQAADPAYAIARGAAFSALIALGRLTLDDLPAKVKIAACFKPQKEHQAVYRDLFREFLHSFKANRGTFARLRRWTKTRA
jgi:xylulokinase